MSENNNCNCNCNIYVCLLLFVVFVCFIYYLHKSSYKKTYNVEVYHPASL